MPDIRQRKPAASNDSDKPVSKEVLKKEDGSGFPFLDILRALVFVLLASSALSYFVTGESFTWGVQRPKWSRLDVMKAYMVNPPALPFLPFPPQLNYNFHPTIYNPISNYEYKIQAGPKQYTDADLARYDGSNPDLPILLAINGTIYDVSAGRKFYGPGGSYSFFAGADASRAFVTNCFTEDRNPDLRGAELAFIPRDDAEVDGLYKSGELKNIKALEKRNAKLEVHKALKHWVDFFENNPKYTKIGRVKREPGWETKGPLQTLCEKAEAARPSARARPEGK
ncbi:Cytochrome P450 regulator [Lachnellula subtilissima]|uniref:Cytochrome P450 regulator n=1 Tax=Lachnellula subtilissima TaxID=602034 RepID=A0A8H8U871_9HELO|nr:Cytochrome P450 regulator [Lachnellula subtilissima]